jgi:hypothetical protein
MFSRKRILRPRLELRTLPSAFATVLLLPCLPEAKATPAVTLEYIGDHRTLLAKADDWRDPASPEDRAPLDSYGRALATGRQVEIAPAGFTWDTRLRVLVRISAARNGGAVATLEGSSDKGWLSFAQDGQARREPDGSVAFTLMARAPLPHEIAELDGEVLWRGKAGRRSVVLGRSHHVLLVTAGPPRPADAWAVTGAGTVPQRPDHNVFTLYRLRGAIRVARGTRSATDAAAAAWRHAQHHYDIFAEPDVNPWALLDHDQYGQCMTAGAFIEAVHKILGFQNGRIVYVYPALARPKNPNLTVIPHPTIPGAFTVETDVYDVRGQFRRVAADDAKTPVRRHSTAQAARHKGAHGIERLKFLDGNRHLHNYATAFVIEEDGLRTYFGGGYRFSTLHDAESFLAAACDAVVWTYEEGDSEEWETVCDGPDSGYWWGTGERYRP